MRKKDPFWQYATQDGNHFTCNFCNIKYAGGVSRLKSHLALIPGRDVNLCPQVSEEVQSIAVVAIEKMGVTGKKRTHSEVVSNSSCEETGSSLRQTTIPTLVNKKDKEAVDMKVSMHFIKNNIAFNVIQTEAFQEMIEAVSNFGPGYKLPSYSTLRTKLVKNNREIVEEYVAEVKGSWSICGCTVMSDMWTDMNGRSYINVIASSPNGAVFLRSFERSADKHTGDFLKDLLVSVIEEIGAEHVVQIVFDNASNYGRAGDLLMRDYPHIYKSRCVAHGIQLLLKDMYKDIGWIKEVFDKAKDIVDYMYKHGIITNVMRDFTEKELQKPVKTRFASQFLMLQSVLEAEDGLHHTVASSTWRNLPYSKTIAAQNVVNIIQSTDFWKEGSELVKFLEPLVRILRLADGDGSTSGYLYEAMERARRSLKVWYNQNPEKYAKAMELFESRRTSNILDKVHAAGAYLNPSLMYDKKITCNDPEVRDGLLFLGSKMLDLVERELFAQQLLDYDGKDPNIFHFMSVTQMRIAHPSKLLNFQ